MWTENEGKRGSKEICSSILAFLEAIDLTEVKHVKSFSDACGGQNRNKNVICFFMWLCDVKGFETWEHTFMESGHSYLPNDRDFSVIEKKAKRKSIFSKQEWFALVKSAMTKQPFEVIEMKNKMKEVEILSKSRVFKNTNTSDGNKFNFLQLRSFKISKHSSAVHYTTVKDNAKFQHTLQYPLVGEKTPETLPDSNASVEISREKYNDIISLLPYVPPVNHHFYETLPHL